MKKKEPLSKQVSKALREGSSAVMISSTDRPRVKLTCTRDGKTLKTKIIKMVKKY